MVRKACETHIGISIAAISENFIGLGVMYTAACTYSPSRLLHTSHAEG